MTYKVAVTRSPIANAKNMETNAASVAGPDFVFSISRMVASVPARGTSPPIRLGMKTDKAHAATQRIVATKAPETALA